MSVEVYWLPAAGAEVPPGDDWLSQPELAVVGRLRVPKRRADWRLGRWVAKRAIAVHLGLSVELSALAEIEVRAAPSGAPEAFLGGRTAGVAISLSHSGGAGFCAISSPHTQLGCDVERVEERGQAFLADYFTPEEQAFIARHPAGERTGIVNLLWSAKESGFKVLGCGLRADTRSVMALPDDAPAASAGWRPMVVRPAGRPALRGWWREAGGFTWTVVAEPEPLSPIGLGSAGFQPAVPASCRHAPGLISV